MWDFATDAMFTLRGRLIARWRHCTCFYSIRGPTCSILVTSVFGSASLRQDQHVAALPTIKQNPSRSHAVVQNICSAWRPLRQRHRALAPSVKCMILYSAEFSPFTLSSPGRPVHSDTNSASLGSILAMQQLRNDYVLIYTTESTEAS